MSHSKNSSISDQLSYFNYQNPGSSMLSVNTSPAISVQTLSTTDLNNMPGLSLDQDLDPLKIILPASNPHSPYHISLPYQTTQPTEELSKRFTIWKKIIKQLIFYFKELAMLRQHYYQLNVHMLNNIQFLSLNNKNKPKTKSSSTLLQSTPALLEQQQHHQNDLFFGTSEDKFINYSFLPTNSKSVQGISTSLYNYHRSLSDRELQTYNELTLKIIPRLENLKKSLNFKIKEIMGLKSDFKFTHLRAEVAKTGQVLNSYINSVEYLEKGFISGVKDSQDIKMSGKYDPYLIKIQLDLQLKKQLLEENYLKEAFNNLQTSGLELEKIIYKELQTAITNFTRLIQGEVELVKKNLIDDLNQNFLSNSPDIDWNYYMNNDNGRNFLNTEEKKKFRKLSDITYPYQRQVISLSLRSGNLNKKNKVTKTYTKFYYVLTMNYLHEFKTNDRLKDQNPIMSLNLNTCSIAEYHDRKFIIQYISKEKGKTTYVFKCEDAKEALKWVSDISELVSFKTSVERNKYFEIKYLSSYPSSTISSGSSSTSNLINNNNNNFKQPSSSAASVNTNFTPQHMKSSSFSNKNASSPSLSKQNSSSSLSKLAISHLTQQDDPGKFTTHLNLSSNNLVPSINIMEHSPSSRNSSGSSVMTNGKSGDYFSVKPVNSQQQQQQQQNYTYPSSTSATANNSLTMMIDKNLPSYASGMRTPPKQLQLQLQQLQQLMKNHFKLNLPSQKLTQSQIDEFANGIKTPGELPRTSIGEIIHGFQNQQINDDGDDNDDDDDAASTTAGKR